MNASTGRLPALLLVAFAGQAGAARAQAVDSALAGLIGEAWQVVDTTYYDASFHGVNWASVGAEFRARRPSNRAEAYAAIREMLARLGNPATRFLTPEQAAALVTEFTGQAHEGPGLLELLSVDTDEGSGDIVIVTPMPGGPAARAGLRSGDVLIAVDGAAPPALGLAETMTRLRGAAGTSVELGIRRGADTLDLELERARIPAIEPVEGFARMEGDMRVGYAGLRQFTADAFDRMAELVDRFEADGVEAIVLDLRDNPGGLVPAVQGIAGLFLGAVPIARLRGRSADAELLAQGTQRVEWRVVVLVNEGSASAAEVLAGALKSHGRARIVGVRTFGKGLAHGLVPLSDGSAVMVTAGRLATLGGQDILDHGIRPDVIVPSDVAPVIAEDVAVGSPGDVQYRRAVELLSVHDPRVRGPYSSWPRASWTRAR